MTSDCGVCGRPTPDNATICPRCAFALDAALADVAAHHGLAWDLDLAISRQTRMAARNGGRGTETPVMFNKRASAARAELKNALVGWARIIITETGVGTIPLVGPACRGCRHGSCRQIRTRGLPPDTLGGVAAWLRRYVEWLRHHEGGAEAYDQITEAVRVARHAVDRPAERIYAGPCNECGEGMYALAGALTVECRGCELVYDVAARRDWLLAALEDHLAHAALMSRLLTYLGIKLADSSIRMYASKGRIGAHGQDGQGRPLYRLGEVVRTFYGANSKARAS